MAKPNTPERSDRALVPWQVLAWVVLAEDINGQRAETAQYSLRD